MATFDPRFREDFYPLSRLIVSRENDLGLSPDEVDALLAGGEPQSEPG